MVSADHHPFKEFIFPKKGVVGVGGTGVVVRPGLKCKNPPVHKAPYISKIMSRENAKMDYADSSIFRLNDIDPDLKYFTGDPQLCQLADPSELHFRSTDVPLPWHVEDGVLINLMGEPANTVINYVDGGHTLSYYIANAKTNEDFMFIMSVRAYTCCIGTIYIILTLNLIILLLNHQGIDIN
jgi:hypothetical protein